MSFNAIRENKIHAKNSRFTVPKAPKERDIRIQAKTQP